MEFPPPLGELHAGEQLERRSRRRRTAVLVGLFAMFAFAGTALLVAAVGGGDSTVGGAEASAAFTKFEGALDYTRGYADLDQCPFNIVAAVDQASAEVHIPDAVVHGTVTADAYAQEPEYPAIVQCFIAPPNAGSRSSGTDSFGLSVSGLPSGSYRRFLQSTAYGTRANVTVDRSYQWHNGDVFSYCFVGELSGCGADWVDRENNVAIAVYLEGDSVTAAQANKVLRSQLGELLLQVAGFHARTTQTPRPEQAAARSSS